MKTIDNEHIRIILVDFYAFYQDACKYKDRSKYSRYQNLTERTFDIINEIINRHNGEKYLGIDMDNISYYPMHLFTNICSKNGKVFFYNIKEKGVRLRMKEDLPHLFWINDEVACFSKDYQMEIEQLLNSDCKDARRRNSLRIVNDIMLETDRPSYSLASSGMYSSCYLTAKKLFTEVEDFYYVIFSLAELVMRTPRLDALVSSSKNGAVIASVLGDLLKIKEVHLLGVGPKYSTELGESVSCIKEGKRYLYIFDFMCTGTELKIVSALISSKKALLQGAVGISRYHKEIGTNICEEINVLVESNSLKAPYYLAGSKEDINILKGESRI